MTENVGTSSSFHVLPTFDTNDYNRKNITQNEPVDPLNINDHDLSNYDSPATSDDLPNVKVAKTNVHKSVSWRIIFSTIDSTISSHTIHSAYA
ncbi:hypothetical protein H5410_015577 [Solanum commersonii]|uniref:Uncharacterized protein n=1 Tax=Solanum commersonii TaxID=4109 RepID=A0A9J5ZU57_SOLCO|nr:hypothetical protein H5410_015577 [Solanum commersonii]